MHRDCEPSASIHLDTEKLPSRLFSRRYFRVSSVKHCGAAGEGRPALDRDVDIGRGDLYGITASAIVFGGDNLRAGSTERLEREIPRIREGRQHFRDEINRENCRVFALYPSCLMRRQSNDAIGNFGWLCRCTGTVSLPRRSIWIPKSCRLACSHADIFGFLLLSTAARPVKVDQRLTAMST